MRVGLFFGSFNPIHNGHIEIALAMLSKTDLDMLWFVVSPVNPFKTDHDLLNERIRYDLVHAATKDLKNIEVSDYEFQLPRPSFTIDTLKAIEDDYPEHEFTLILGEDNLDKFHLWKDSDEILSSYKLYVYPRPGGSSEEWKKVDSVTFLDAPVMKISATDVRKKIRNGESLKNLVPKSVEYIIKDERLFI